MTQYMRDIFSDIFTPVTVKRAIWSAIIMAFCYMLITHQHGFQTVRIITEQ